MSQARNSASEEQSRSGRRIMVRKASWVKPSEDAAQKSALDLTVQAAAFARPANSTSAPHQFLKHPGFALRASAAIAGREIGRILVLRKG